VVSKTYRKKKGKLLGHGRKSLDRIGREGKEEGARERGRGEGGEGLRISRERRGHKERLYH